jgi:hypothetical protein
MNIIDITKENIVNLIAVMIVLLLVFHFFIFKKSEDVDLISESIIKECLIENLSEVIIQTPFGFKSYKYLTDTTVLVQQERDIYRKDTIIKLKIIMVR